MGASECRLRRGDGGREGGEEGRGWEAEPETVACRRPAVRQPERSAPPAADKGWEDACALGGGLRAAGLPPERLLPPPVSDREDPPGSAGASSQPLSPPSRKPGSPTRPGLGAAPARERRQQVPVPGGSARERELRVGVRGAARTRLLSGCLGGRPRPSAGARPVRRPFLVGPLVHGSR